MANPFKTTTPKMSSIGGSAGILDDFAVRKDIATRSGTVEKVPTHEHDIANKKYVDDAVSGSSPTLQTVCTAGNTTTTDIKNYADNKYHYFGAGNDVKIGYTGTYWDFDIAATTASFRFNPSGYNTDFSFAGVSGGGNILTLDASKYSTICGYATAEMGQYSLLAGFDVQVTSNYSGGGGFYSRITGGNYSFGWGLGVYATADAAVAFGNYTKSQSAGSFAAGYSPSVADFYAGDTSGYGQIVLGYASGGGGEITALSLASGGNGYVVDQVVGVSGGGGSGGTVTVTSANAIGDFAITGVNSTPTNGGSNYTDYDVLTVSAGNNDATVQVTTDGYGVVTSVGLNSGGTGYSVGSGISTTYGGSGYSCSIEITSVAAGGEITGISLTSGGTGYTTGTGVALAGGATVDLTTVTPLNKMIAEKSGSVAIGQDVISKTNANCIVVGRGFFADTQDSFNVGFTAKDLQVTSGKLKLFTIPRQTSTAGLSTGDVWCDTTGGLNILKIV